MRDSCNEIQCSLCGAPLTSKDNTLPLMALCSCGTCGTYRITDAACRFSRPEEIASSLHLLSGVVRDYQKKGLKPPLIDETIMGNIAAFRAFVDPYAPRTVAAKSERILRHVAANSNHPGAQVGIDSKSDYPVGFCRNAEEMHFYIKHLTQRGMFETLADDGVTSVVEVTADGWAFLESKDKPNTDSTQAFVAMWFDDSMKSIFDDGMQPAGMAADFQMVRIDRKDFNEKICDEIIAEIRRSRFVVADVTGHRQGVYFEAGYAMGLGLPVIWTCREDEVSKCHFDTRQYNHIVWKDSADLKEKLLNRIRATIGTAGKAIVEVAN